MYQDIFFGWGEGGGALTCISIDIFRKLLMGFGRQLNNK
jgi:hypothetical protein